MKMLLKLTSLSTLLLLGGCQTLPDASWQGYRKAEAIVLADSQLDQIDNKRSDKRYNARATALTVIRTMRILGQNNGQ